ncbi:SDR family NAD(P)-dependent oxidoreductase [Thiorhodococcus minor]|uniref:SDR family NAD(P)-dependent oxidoreductase n=1 Tax=Thiorhodococcus minor TaxID=57489 RepID=A0A6M0K0G8_9GAMM|nr:SDR family NAD(P)-dependent oxidoreductase [Thiorhodococcus minor]NEV62831.1 SDR family NAD(P)-dependent oxidoreductase [Thiorhodococcus minor]
MMIAICEPAQGRGSCSAGMETRAAVLRHPGVQDCALLTKSDSAGQVRRMLFYVPRGLVSRSDLRRLVESAGPEAPAALVPLHKLPLTPDGLVDEEVLAAIPVLDDAFCQRSERLLRAELGTEELCVRRIQQAASSPAPYHLSDLLADGGATDPPGMASESADLEPSCDAGLESAVPAVLHGPVLPPDGAASAPRLPDLLERAVRRVPNRRIRFVSAQGRLTEWSYAGLWERARRIRAALADQGVAPGAFVLFQLRAIQDLLAAFWGCQLGGMVPIVLEAPERFDPSGETLDRLKGLVGRLKAPVILADAGLAEGFETLQAEGRLAASRVIPFAGLVSAPTPQPRPAHRAHPDDIALVNLSSGSTGIPKGIMLSHRNLLARARGANALCQFAEEDVILNWLPLDHIGSLSDWHIRCVMLGCELIYVDKEHVLRDPANWLALMDRYRVTHSWAPSFAFALVAKRLTELPALEWDLSCVKGLLTAGEAVSDRSVEALLEVATTYGLRWSAIWAAYGMAELGSGVTYAVPSAQRPLGFLRLRPPASGERARPVADEDPSGVSFADLGPPIPGVSLRVVGTRGEALPPGYVGRLQVAGAVVFQGYLGNAEATAEVLLPGGWLDTGDLGLLWQGRLVLTGREKDTIIVNGANYFCHEIEATLGAVEGVQQAQVAACGARRPGDSEERLAVFFVPEDATPKDREAEAALMRAISARVADRFGISPGYLLPVERQQIPRTSIGKIQRSQLRLRLESGALDDAIKRADLALGNGRTLPSWLYRACWLQCRAVSASPYPLPGATLILTDSAGFGRSLGRDLRQGHRQCIEVLGGEVTERLDVDRYRVDLSSSAGLRSLFRDLAADGIAVSEVIHLMDYGAQAPSALDAAGEAQGYPGIAALLHCLRALEETAAGGSLKRLFLVADGCHCVRAEDRGRPEKAMLAGMVRSLVAEYPGIAARHIDLSGADRRQDLSDLAQELESLSREPLVAYRDGLRHVLRLDHLDLRESGGRGAALKRDGLYLVTGGLGGLGMALCRWLGRRLGARLLILGRSSPTSAEVGRQEALRSLVDEGISCRYVATDICEREALQRAVEQAEAAWGREIDGIFHLAGQARARPIRSETLDDFTAAGRAKVEGTRALGALLGHRPNAFMLAFSSATAVLGGTGTAAYSAANAYLEAECRRLQRAGHRAYFLAWSRWEGMGMSADQAMAQAAASNGFGAIGASDGLHTLGAFLGSGLPEAMVGLDATRPAIQHLTTAATYQREHLAGYVKAGALEARAPRSYLLRDAFGTPLTCALERVRVLPERGAPVGGWEADGAASAPSLGGEPRTSTEVRLCAIWRRLLDAREVGRDDSFFDLGGNSLLAAQLAGAVESELGLRLPVSAVFQAPTLGALAEILDGDTGLDARWSVVPIKQTGTRTPIFVVQSSSWDLVRYLDADQPVYGLNYGVGAKSRGAMLDLPPTLEALAAHYVSELSSVQASGPYFLIGHSAAGLVAYEMARQLAARGDTLGLVGLVDTYFPRNCQNASQGAVRGELARVLKIPPQRLAIRSRRWARQRLRTWTARSLLKECERPLSIRARHLYDGYVPRPYVGRIAYWKCRGDAWDGEQVAHEEAWKSLAGGGLALHELHCGHQEIMKHPHVQCLADQITSYTF